ncbi:MAG: M20/M25/M40 family metallo-hydrolase [bacterium]|nr:M20/M25/M40 family metallo-hydrolase [bacterium]
MKHLIDRIDSQHQWDRLPALANWVIDQGIAIQQIPAPTFAEGARARYVAAQFAHLGLHEVHTDDLANVYGRLPGERPDLPGLMIAAHTDTIFAADTDLTIRRESGLIYAPGLGDNSIGVSGLLGLAYALHEQRITPQRDLWFVATSREEGLGDLGGMRAAFDLLRGRIDAVINLEGLAYGHIYHAGISVRRLHITATTAGGHSWLHFGKPSAVHAIVELGGRIATIQPPKNPRTTYNIGMISGGEAINAIATRAELWLDMRSEDREALARVERQVRGHIDALTAADTAFTVEVVGDRPAGYLDPAHPLVQNAAAALARQGIQPALETGSTDANIPLAQNCPAVTIGITRGGNAHRLDEYIETAPVAAGMRQLITLALATAEAPILWTK